MIWVNREPEYFYKQDWTGKITLILQENFSSARDAKTQDDFRFYRSREILCKLSRVMLSVLRPRMPAAYSFTSMMFVHTELALIDSRKRAPRRNRWSPRAVESNMKSRSTPSRFKPASCCTNRFSLTLSGLNATFGTVVPARAHQGNAVRLLPWAMPRLPPQL